MGAHRLYFGNDGEREDFVKGLKSSCEKCDTEAEEIELISFYKTAPSLRLTCQGSCSYKNFTHGDRKKVDRNVLRMHAREHGLKITSHHLAPQVWGLLQAHYEEAHGVGVDSVDS